MELSWIGYEYKILNKMMPERKICGECLEEKEAKCFSIRQKKNSEHKWLRKECKDCENKRRKEKYASDPERRRRIIRKNMEYESINREKRLNYYKEYRSKNIDKKKQMAKDRYEKNKEEIKRQRREYYKKDPERHKKIVSIYGKANKDKLLAGKRINHKRKKETDLNYKVMKTLRGRLTAAIKKKGERHAKTKELIGCTIKELIIRIESMFWPGMTWQNHGVHGWHVDHIIPCDKFDLTNEEEQRKCFHYTNLQPLWAADNIRKSNKLDYNPNKAA